MADLFFESIDLYPVHQARDVPGSHGFDTRVECTDEEAAAFNAAVSAFHHWQEWAEEKLEAVYAAEKLARGTLPYKPPPANSVCVEITESDLTTDDLHKIAEAVGKSFKGTLCASMLDLVTDAGDGLHIKRVRRTGI